MKKIKIIGTVLLAVGIIFLAIAAFVASAIPIIGVTGMIIACIGFIFF